MEEQVEKINYDSERKDILSEMINIFLESQKDQNQENVQLRVDTIIRDHIDMPIETLKRRVKVWQEHYGIAATPQPIIDEQDGKHFVWSKVSDLQELDKYEHYIKDNAKPLLGLPNEIILLPGDAVGVSAPTGSGKTTALIGIAVQNINAGKRVGMIILEETAMETKYRISKQLTHREDIVNLGILEVISFKESKFEDELSRILLGSDIDILLIDYINDSFLTFDLNPGLAAYEKIKFTVAKIAAFNHKILKSIVVIGVQGTSYLLTAKKEQILSAGKSYFEGGQSTIKPLQYAILIKDNDGGTYEKNAYVVKARNVLVGGGEMVMPTYGLVYEHDRYQFNLIGSLKDIVRREKEDKKEAAEVNKAEKAKLDKGAVVK